MEKLSRVGWVVSGLAAFALVGSAAGKLAGAAPMVETFARLGIARDLLPLLAIIEIVAAVLYLMPRTALIGLGLAVAYFGGAVFAHVRIGEGFATPVAIGVVLAVGLVLRSAKLREIVLRGV